MCNTIPKNSMINWIKKLFKKDLVIYQTNEIFKVSGVPEHTFVERDVLNSKISDFFSGKDTLLLFLGYSKSGKTVYRKKHLEKNDYKNIIFRCNNSSTIQQLYDQIASECNLGQIITTSHSTEQSKTNGEKLEVSLTDAVKYESSNGVENKYNYIVTSEQTRIKNDVNFLCNTLKNKKVLIILEDYHLVNPEFNKTISEDLKHFLDDGILFVLLGIPSSPNRALRNNPDLSGRLEYLNFDYLSNEEIESIIKKGSNLLNVEFSKEVIDEIIKQSLKNAFLVQNICKQLLLGNKITKTVESNKQKIHKPSDVTEACKIIAEKLNSDYEEIYSIINAGIRKQQETKAFNQYEEILKVLKKLDITILEKGIHYNEIFRQAWQDIEPTLVQEYIKNGTYVDETSFKNSFRTQIKEAVKKINLSLEKSSNRPILYVNDDNIYITDLVFKFYLNWKN